MEIVFATNNQNKLYEVQQLMPDGIRILGLEAIGCHEEIPETAHTLEGNALIKARFVKDRYGYDCFADDTGLEVEGLHGAPGVFSARYAGTDKDAGANIRKLLKELDGHEDRRAQFRTVIALISGSEEYLFEGVCPGVITTEPMGNAGFGYDPVFRPNGQEQTFAQMSMEQKGVLSHRGKAIKRLIAHLSR